MALKVECKEHTVPKKTPWGTVEKSLDQHMVFVENSDTKQMIHAGYVGVKAFLPLAGFPKELVADVTAECEKILRRKLESVDPPPTIEQVAAMLAQDSKEDSEEE